MNVKDVVFQDYQGIRRYGVIRERYEEGPWAHYNRAMKTLAELRGREFYRHTYRVDELRKIDAERELKALFKCLELSNS